MKSEIKVKILLFSHLKYAIGKDCLVLSIPKGSTFADLENHLWKIVGNSMQMIPLRIARNAEFVDSHDQINDGDEVAFIPPVQGG
jgi:molybdopterin synthase sulfur carrier subunit